MNDETRAALMLTAAAAGLLWWWMRMAPAAGQVVGEGGGLSDLASADGGGDVFSSVVDVASEAANFFIPVGYAMSDSNLQAFLMLIRTGEGTADAGGYSRLFGGGSFADFGDHPRVTVNASGYKSTAAGAYQILSRTWDDLRLSGYSLPDFSPENQDKAAVALIKRRGALADVLAGRWEQAIAKCNKEWASLPGSPYGQPTLSMAKAKSVLLAYGGQPDTAGSIMV